MLKPPEGLFPIANESHYHYQVIATAAWGGRLAQGSWQVHVFEDERISRSAAAQGGGASAAQPRPARRRAGGRHRARRRLLPPPLHQQGEADPDEVNRRWAAARTQIYPKRERKSTR